MINEIVNHFNTIFDIVYTYHKSPLKLDFNYRTIGLNSFAFGLNLNYFYFIFGLNMTEFGNVEHYFRELKFYYFGNYYFGIS